jgi:hypothetical protein
VPVLLPDLSLTEMHNRVIELQARHWEMVSLVREGNDAVLERLGRSSGPGGPR